MNNIQKISSEEKKRHIKQLTDVVKKYCHDEGIISPNDSGLALSVFCQICIDNGMSKEDYSLMASMSLFGV